MAESNFIDSVTIFCRSGKGGPGSLHFRRAKYLPKGGPDGGDGGRGGNIYLRGNRNLWTLLHLRYRKHVIATDGQGGGNERSFGRDGEDVYIDVPCGTVAYDALTGDFLHEVRDDGEVYELLHGGRGGRGNWHFRTATNQAPRYAQPGEPSQEKTIILQLKVLADVGLVGFPNTGKSTLLASLSAATPEIADYPFTTLTPNLGIVSYRDEGQSFCMADIPGIIEGASEGKGLGLRFLRHIERNAVLLFVIPCTSEDILKDYQILLHELEQYNPLLLSKSRVLALSKSDLLTEPLPSIDIDIPVVLLSAITHQGLDELKDVLWRELSKKQNQVIDISHAPLPEEQRRKEQPTTSMVEEEADEPTTIYLNEQDKDWDLDKYKGIGWDE